MYSDGYFLLKDAYGFLTPVQIRISPDDKHSDFLFNKMFGDGIDISILNDGYNELLKVATSVTNPGPYRFSINPGNLLRSGTSGSAVAEGFAINEFAKNQTAYGAHDEYWIRDSANTVSLKIKFSLKFDASSNNYVRIAARTKARASGENISGAFDVEAFSTVDVSNGSAGDIYEASIDLTPTNFEQNDAVTINIGRDGSNMLSGPGNNDNYNKSILLIATDAEVQ